MAVLRSIACDEEKEKGKRKFTSTVQGRGGASHKKEKLLIIDQTGKGQEGGSLPFIKGDLMF